MILDIIIPDASVFFIIIVMAVIIIIILRRFSKIKDEISNLKIEAEKKESTIREYQLTFNQKEAELKLKSNEWALVELEKFKTNELIIAKKALEELADDGAKNKLFLWIAENEDRIRKDAANRSVRSVMGKVTEHLIPFSEAFSQFNPKDARFIGSPIDLIVFDGVEEKKNEITIFFLEIKTGSSALSQRQKKIMEAVKDKRVEWLRLDIKDFGEEVNKSL